MVARHDRLSGIAPHGGFHPDPVFRPGGFGEQYSLGEDLAELLTQSRTLFVDLDVRQELADAASSIYPLIDWQPMVDDLGPRLHANNQWDLFPAIEVAVDPGGSQVPWNVNFDLDGAPRYFGPGTIPLYPGRNTITLGDGHGVDVLLYPDGRVVPYDEDQATGGTRELHLETATVTIDAGRYTGWWGFFNHAMRTGDQTFVLAVGFEYDLQIGAEGRTTFHVDSPTSVSTLDPGTLAPDGTTVTFRTTPTTFRLGDYAEGVALGEWTLPHFWTDATLDLVQGIPYRLEFPAGGVIVELADDGTFVAPPGSPLIADGSTVYFTPSRLTVTTAATGWRTQFGNVHDGTSVISVMPTGSFEFQVPNAPWQRVWVDAACNVSPSTFTLGGFPFALTCAPYVDNPHLPTWYADTDGDGYGDAGSASPVPLGRPGETQVGGDCDDTTEGVSPAVTEIWFDGVDQDCSGGSDYDFDGDGSTPPGAPDGSGDDCDDGDPSVFAGNLELCDGRLNGCQADGTAFDEAGIATWFPVDGVPVDVTAQLAGAPGAPATYRLPTDGEVVLCDGTWYATLRADRASDVTVRGLNGPEVTILSPEGQNRGLLVDHASATVTVDGLTIANGVSPAVEVLGGLSRNSCRGGAILGFKGSLVVVDSVLRDNYACSDGAGLSSSGPVTMLDTEVVDNEAPYYAGVALGAITACELSGVTIERNLSTAGSEALSAYATPLTLRDSSVSFNQAGGISMGRGLLEGVVIEGNTGTGLRVQNGALTVRDSTIASSGNGGITAWTGTDLLLERTVVRDNLSHGMEVRNGATTRCVGEVGGPGGFLRNGRYGVAFDGNLNNRFVAETCDFGVGAADNLWADVSSANVELGDDVSGGWTPMGPCPATGCVAGCVDGSCGQTTWSANAQTYGLSCPADVGHRFSFVCPPAGGNGRLWGTGVYTDESSICTAAQHAGLITQATGGAVTLEMAPGQPSYLGTTSNGVTSSSYGAWGCSYTFP